MTYTAFDPALPDPGVGSGTTLGQNTRDNLLALRDMIAMGSMPGFDFSVSGGTAEQPAIIYYKKSTEWIKAALTWGTTGGEDGNVTVAVYSYSSNSGSSYDTIGTETMTYDASGNCTATTWS